MKTNMTSTIRRTTVAATGAVVACALAVFSGCSDRLAGTPVANQPPVVEFVNIPPENSTFSTNPILFWIGRDVDGQVTAYRYTVVLEDEIADSLGTTAPLDSMQVASFVTTFLPSRSDTAWTVLEVDLQQSQDPSPKTEDIVQLQAELSDPVNTFVAQYVFLQCFDDQGAESAVVWRRLLRNDNPPETALIGYDANMPPTFINSVLPFGITGAKFTWSGSDVIDYPSDPPPFEFEWRVYGPYAFNSTDNALNDTIFERILDQFVKPVFRTFDGSLFVLGNGETYSRFDSIPNDTGFQVDSLIVFVDTLNPDSSYAFGSFDVLLDVDDPAFVSDPEVNKLAAQSTDGVDEWVFDTRDSIYNLFSEAPADTTQSAQFFFWIRSRDDALVPDLTPAFGSFTSVDPKYERDIGIVNTNFPAFNNRPNDDSLSAFWERTLNQFYTDNYPGAGLAYDPDRDFIGRNSSSFALTTRIALSFKTLVLVDDEVTSGFLRGFGNQVPVTTALQSGVNVWYIGRAPLGISNQQTAPQQAIFYDLLFPGFNFFFGGIRTNYSGWMYLSFFGFDGRGLQRARVDQFVGAVPADPNSAFPELNVDINALRPNIDTDPPYDPVGGADVGVYRYATPAQFLRPVDIDPENDTIAVGLALPEVNWSQVNSSFSEVLYLYRSYFGANPPWGSTFNFQARPVAWRTNRGFFRTAFSHFSPIAMEQPEAQEFANLLLLWLYGPQAQLSPGQPKPHDPTAKVPATQDELREMFFDRIESEGKGIQHLYQLDNEGNAWRLDDRR